MNEYKLASDTWDHREVNAINKVIESGKYTMGSCVEKFENEFAKYHGAKYGVMTNSGSSANLLMLATILYNNRFPSQGNIIVPAVSWSTTYFPVSQMGFKLKFVDVDLTTYNLDHTQVEDAIDDETIGIFSVNLLGNPSHLKELSDIAIKNNIFLIEDNCESLGASIGGKLAGTFGIMGTSSFFYSHHIQTMEGGMVLTDSTDLSHYLKSLRAHGWIRDLPEKNNLYKKSNFAFDDSFKFVLPGFCVRPLEMSGAIGSVQLEKWPEMLALRKENAIYLKKQINEIKFLNIQTEHESSSWFGFGFIINSEAISRNQFIKFLERNNIETRPIVAGNFTKNPVIELLDHDIHMNLSNSDIINDQGFFIGNDSIDLKDKIDYFIDICKSYKQ